MSERSGGGGGWHLKLSYCRITRSEMSRQRKITCEQALEAVREEDGVVQDAAKYLGCSARTIYRRAEEDDRIWAAIEQERGELVVEMREVVKEAARDPEADWTSRLKAAFKILAVFDEEVDWADRKRTDITSGGDPITEVNLNVVHTDADDFEQEVRE